MINAAARTGNYLKATTQVVSNALKPALSSAQVPEKLIVAVPPPASTNHGLALLMPKGGISVTSGVAVNTQVRFAHTDMQVPDFTPYRRDSTKNPGRKNTNEAQRKTFSYLLVGSGAVGATYGAKNLVTHFVSSMSASADVLALAKIEVNLSDIPEGKSMTFKWRGKPLFIRHRTPAEIATEKAVPLSSLRDPQHDDDRVKREAWLVVIGVCTHLGCVPIPNAGDFGGYYCPCHGSHYDSSGRIRKGPAPLNLEVPQHDFPEDGLLIVG